MRLEDYFEFLSPDDIRFKGHRIGIDDVLYYYLDGYTPEEIVANLPSLNLEQIHAAITYYLRNRTKMDDYLSRLATWREQRYREWEANPPRRSTPAIIKGAAYTGNHPRMKVRFLLDENVSPRVKVALLRFNPAIADLTDERRLLLNFNQRISALSASSAFH